MMSNLLVMIGKETKDKSTQSFAITLNWLNYNRSTINPEKSKFIAVSLIKLAT